MADARGGGVGGGQYGLGTLVRPSRSRSRARAAGSTSGDDFQVVCLPQSSGGFAVAKLDDGDLDVALLGSTPAATGLARGVRMQTFYVAHMKGTSQGFWYDPRLARPWI